MMVLLSAYACEPNKGSEPGVGWHWALEISGLGHDVWVLTRTNNQEAITDYFIQHQQPDNLNFLYYDLPKWAKWWKKGGRGVHIYYLLWQWMAYFFVKKIHKKIHFELVHHLTFGVVRHPSFMGNLKIPFIVGPIGGGERCSWKLRKGFGVKGFIIDGIRDVFNFLIKFDLLMWLTFTQANKIYVKTPESKKVISSQFGGKIEVLVEIGIDPVKIIEKPTIKKTDNFHILYVGRFIYWKGMYIGLCAVAEIIKTNPSVHLTLVGAGPDEKRWKDLVNNLGINDHITWISWLPQNELSQLYKTHDILLFPSLHDSSGNVLLEAMTHALPVVCFNLGGPGVIIKENYGIKINVNNLNQKDVINALSTQIKLLINNPNKLTRLQEESLIEIPNFSWNKTVLSIYNNFKNI